MKKIAIIIVLASALFSCRKSAEGEFIIEGEVNDLPNGKYVVLQKQDDSLGSINVDTTKLKDGKFTFTGKVSEPKMHIITILGEKSSAYVILESGDIKIKMDKDSIQKNEYGGTFNNDELQKFTKETYKFAKKLETFEKVNRPKAIVAQQFNKTEVLKKIQANYDKLAKESKDFTLNYIKENNDSFISVLLIKSMFNDFDPNLKEIQNYYSSLSDELKSSSEGKSLQKLIKKFSIPDSGKRAPDFSAKTPEGKVLSLKESLGKVTIIDFWASWCGPCRKENPNVVKLYKEFHTKGLNIIGVSLDKDAKKWKKAILDDKLTWNHVSNLQEWNDPIAKLYAVNSIPQTFILNKYGVIVARDLTGDALRNKVIEILNTK